MRSGPLSLFKLTCLIDATYKFDSNPVALTAVRS